MTRGGIVGPQPLRVAPADHRESGAGDCGGDEHEHGEEQHRLGAAELVEDDGGHGHDEAADGAEEGEPGVQGGVARLFLALGGVGRMGLESGHLGHESAFGDEVQLGADEDEKGERKEQEAVDVQCHQRAQDGATDPRRHDHEATGAAAAVDQGPEDRGDDGERRQREEEVEEDLVVGRVRGDGEEQRARQRNRDQRVASEHRRLHEGEPADGVRLVEQVLAGLPRHLLELLDLGRHRHRPNVRCAVTVHAYVLIQTDVGRAAHVVEEINAVEGVLEAEGVTGPYDVIARAEATSMNDLGRMVVRDFQEIQGITRTITCPVVKI